MAGHVTFVEDAVKDSRLGPFHVPDINDRDFYEQIPASYRALLIDNGESALEAEIPSLLLSDYMDFSITGNRTRFEDKYFKRRKMLASLVLAEAVENKGRFTGKILDVLYSILEETSWCLPAHNSLIRDAVQDQVPSDSRPVIDLFAAETAATVSLTRSILAPVFEKISPVITGYVDEELDKRIVAPYTTYHFWWMGDGRSKMLNWTPWITSNVLITVLVNDSISITPQVYDKILSQAALSLDYFLDEYGDDGCCDEGAEYYSHAALCLYTALHLLDKGTDDDSIKQLYELDRIRNMASYIVRVHAAGRYYINFADCSPIAGRRTAGEYCFGKAAGLKDLMDLAVSDIRSETPEEKTLPDEISLYQRLRQAAMIKEIESQDTAETVPEDVYYISTGLMVSRDDTFILAVKAGDNGDAHNHNDVGSFILYVDGSPCIIDLGVVTYTKQTFSADRYSIWTMQSQYHNLPTFITSDGKRIQQHDGEEYKASDVDVDITPGRASMSMDISGAYDCLGLKSYKRTVEFIKNKGITITDVCDGDVGYELSLMVPVKPVITGNVISIGMTDVVVDRALKINVEERPITDERLSRCWKRAVYRITIVPESDTVSISIKEDDCHDRMDT